MQWHRYGGYLEKREIGTKLLEVKQDSKKKSYSQPFKIDTVRLVTEQDYKVSGAARNPECSVKQEKPV